MASAVQITSSLSQREPKTSASAPPAIASAPATHCDGRDVPHQQVDGRGVRQRQDEL